MFRSLSALAMIALALSCSEKRASTPEKTYPMTATIVARDPADQSVTLDNKDVPGVMEAMRMDYPVRGTNINTLPPDGTPVDVTLHQQDGRYWVTDVKPNK